MFTVEINLGFIYEITVDFGSLFFIYLISFGTFRNPSSAHRIFNLVTGRSDWKQCLIILINEKMDELAIKI